jgi:ABC-2 type transport system ATP-binding protein
MDFRSRPRGRKLAALAALVVLLVATAVTLVIVARQPVPVTARTLRIAVADGPGHDQHVSLDATFFTPPGHGRVPAILLAHGFGETKDAVRPEAEQLARAGFAVLTWSARGFGRSTGQVALDAPDYEVSDVEQLVSWLARQPRVRLDRPGDPRVGITGASYGGALALLAAAYDHRIDAIVPQTTWYNLATALFPNAASSAGVPAGPADGVFKKQWAGLLFTQGTAGFGAAPAAGRGARAAAPAGVSAAPALEALCGRFLPAVCAMYQQVATAGRATPQAISLLERSSPSSVAGRIDVPTLLIQGESDSLFGLDQANANYQAIQRNGAPVDMAWFAGGHDGGNQETSQVNQLTEQWFERWLKPATSSGIRPFAVSRELGFDASTGQEQLGVATAPRYPGLAGTRRTPVRLRGPAQTIINPPGGAPPSMSVLPGLGAGSQATGSVGAGLPMPGQSAAFTSAPLSAPLQQTGSATVRVRVSGAADVTVFAEVYDVDQAGNATLPFGLAAPVRVTSAANGAASGAANSGAANSGAAAGRTVTVTLPAMDYQFAAGHRLRLVLTSTDFGYATSRTAAAYRVALAGRGLSVPSDPALQITGGGAAWWTWAAPAAALAAAAVILLARRRPGRGAGGARRRGRR